MKTSTRLYAWLKLLTVLHIVEQLIFGMEDLHQLQHMVVMYESWVGNADAAIALLVIGGIALAVLATRWILSGGFARFLTMFILGLPTIGELHHLVESIRVGHYTPGVVTAVPSIVCGVLFLRALVMESRPSKNVSVAPVMQLPVAAEKEMTQNTSAQWRAEREMPSAIYDESLLLMVRS